MTGIKKRFGETFALRGVDYRAFAGRVNAIIGENGAGKTTLMKILFGLTRPDSGDINIEGGLLSSSHTAKKAIEFGLGMLQQHLSLVPAFTVLENIVLGCEPGGGLKLDLKSALPRIREILEDLGSGTDPNSRVYDLQVSARQQVEIARMLFSRARIMIFDEPTAALAPDEIQKFYTLVRSLAEKERTIILITHRLNEVLEFADNVTVLRKGLVTARLGKCEMSEQKLISAIMPEERTVRALVPAPARIKDNPVLQLDKVSCSSESAGEILTDISLSIRPGEILGIAGVTGSGQLELAETVAGLRKPLQGSILLDGRDVSRLDTATRRRLGMTYIPEDRLADGVIPRFNLILNRLMGDHRSSVFRASGAYRTALLREDVRDKIDRYGIDAESPDTPLSALSGGNQQKVMLARELDRITRLVVAHGPTRGLDLKSARHCYQRLLELAKLGSAVMLFSTELEDLLSYSHRIAVLFAGHLIEAGNSSELDTRRVGLLMTRGRAA